MAKFGDHGSIIVIAPLFKPTREIQFSLDQGLTWNSSFFSNELVSIDNILVDPKSTSSKFSIHGHFSNTESRKGVIISIDFNQLGVRECQGASSAGEEKSDYELWTPYDG